MPGGGTLPGSTPQLPAGWSYQKTGLFSGVVTHTWVQRQCSGGARTGMPWCWWQTDHQQFNVGTICTGGARTGLPHCYPASDFLTPGQGRDVFLTIMLTSGSAGLSAILGGMAPEDGAAAADDVSAVDYTGSQGAGKDLKRTATVNGDQWQFNTGHGFDRVHTGPGGVQTDLRTTGLSADQIEQGIAGDVYDYMGNGGSIPRPGPAGPYQGSLNVGGYNVGYRVVQTPDGVYRVPTYWLNP